MFVMGPKVAGKSDRFAPCFGACMFVMGPKVRSTLVKNKSLCFLESI